MTVWQAIENRRTVHHYLENSPLDTKLLQQALELALLAPNHKFTFPWKFLRVGEKTRMKLAELAVDFAREKDPSADSEKIEKSRKKVLSPSELIVFYMKKSTDEKRQKEDYASVACAVQNFTLSLVAHGYQSKWSSGRLSSDPRTYDLLSIDSEIMQIAGFIWVGKPLQIPGARRRPPLNECYKELP